jgi:NAD(P)-dependent dehydrogenase (short-subunit alcohol dehydrogenase family)
MSTTLAVNPHTVFLVSGGARGITAAATIKLAQACPCKFILLGRSALSDAGSIEIQADDNEATLKQRIFEQMRGEHPTPANVQKAYRSLMAVQEIQQTLYAIQQTGSEAEYLSVDVTDAIALKQALTPLLKRWGPITGIVHGAGNLADKRIEKKTEQDFEKVYAPKVLGLENLLRCVPPGQLQFLVLFSSVAGFYGNAGQTDYAIANEILNKSAHWIKQRHPDCHVVAIDWGPWNSSGMVSPALQQAFAERGIETIPLDIGAQMFLDELSPRHQNTAQVMIGSPLTIPTLNVNTTPQSHRLRRQLRLADNPFLQDHVIAGKPVLPATCALVWMANACEQLYPGYQLVSYNNYKILNGIVFGSTLAEEYILDITDITKEKGLALETKIWSQTRNGQPRYHFSAQIQLQRHSLDSLSDQSLCIDRKPPTLDQAYQYQQGEAGLFHGPTFQGVEVVLHSSPERIVTQCSVAKANRRQQGQFPVQTVNPYIADVQIHSLWIWTQQFCQQGCLPSEIGQYEQFETIPFDHTFYVTCDVKSQAGTAVVANIIAHDQAGKVYNRMIDAKGTKLPIRQLRAKMKALSSTPQTLTMSASC